MTSRQLDEEVIFHTSRQIDKQSVRSDYLDRVCGDNTALLARVEALLEVHEKEAISCGLLDRNRRQR